MFKKLIKKWFSIKDYIDENATVTLHSYKISFSNDGTNYNTAGEWTKGKLERDNITIPEIIEGIGAKYILVETVIKAHATIIK